MRGPRIPCESGSHYGGITPSGKGVSYRRMGDGYESRRHLGDVRFERRAQSNNNRLGFLCLSGFHPRMCSSDTLDARIFWLIRFISICFPRGSSTD